MLPIFPEITPNPAPTADIEEIRYIKIRVQQNRTLWSAVVRVPASLMEKEYSFKEWMDRIAARYEDSSGYRVDRLLEAGEITEEEANEWFSNRRHYGEPIVLGDQPTPQDCL